jgi:hypothetical protein
MSLLTFSSGDIATIAERITCDRFSGSAVHAALCKQLEGFGSGAGHQNSFLLSLVRCAVD